MDISNTAFLFYRGPGEDFSDKQKLIEKVALDHGDQSLVFNIDGPVRALEELRLNLIPPSAANPNIAYLKLYSICVTLRLDVSGIGTVLIDLRNADELQQHATLSGLTLNKKILGEMYAVTAADPNITLKFTPVVSVDAAANLKVHVSLEYLFGDEYLLARDLFVVNQERLEQKVRKLEVEIRRMEAKNKAFDDYRRSPLWKGFAQLHRAHEKLRAVGIGKVLSRVFQPQWWSKRNQTDYEKWRSSNGYETEKNTDA